MDKCDNPIREQKNESENRSTRQSWGQVMETKEGEEDEGSIDMREKSKEQEKGRSKTERQIGDKGRETSRYEGHIRGEHVKKTID